VRKGIAALAAALLMLLSVGAVFAQKVELLWWAYPRFSTTGKDPGVYEQELVDRYVKANPNITIKIETLNYNGGPAKVNVAIASNTVPDLIDDDPVRLIADYATRGALVTMDDVIDRSTIYDSFVSDSTLDGKFYMYPMSALPICVGVNKTIFEQAGALGVLPLNRPDRSWTWDDFTRALEAVKNVKGVYPTALWAGNEQADVGIRLVLQTFGAKLFAPDGKRLTLNDAAGVKGIEFLVGLKQKGLVAPGPESMLATDAIDLFHQGRVAISIQYDSSQLLPLRIAQKAGKAAQFEALMMPYPSVPGVPSMTSFALTGVAVFKTPDNARIAAAKQFAKWLCTTEDIVLSSIGTVPAVKGMKTYGQIKNDPEVAFVDTWASTRNAYAGKVTKGWAEVRKNWYPNFQAALTGVKSPKQALDDFVTGANEVLKKYYP
jgi:multiple sugar transport system substrate-binding protein